MVKNVQIAPNLSIKIHHIVVTAGLHPDNNNDHTLTIVNAL